MSNGLPNVSHLHNTHPHQLHIRPFHKRNRLQTSPLMKDVCSCMFDVIPCFVYVSVRVTGCHAEEIWVRRPSSRFTRRLSLRSTESTSKSNSSCLRRMAEEEEEEAAAAAAEEEEEEVAAVAAEVEWVVRDLGVGSTPLVPVETRPLTTAGTRCPFPPKTDPSTPLDSARLPRSGRKRINNQILLVIEQILQ